MLKKGQVTESLNENFVGMGMVGNIFERDKTDYEIAFEHYSKSGTVNEEIEDVSPTSTSRDPWEGTIEGFTDIITFIYSMGNRGMKLNLPKIARNILDFGAGNTDLSTLQKSMLGENIKGKMNKEIEEVQDLGGNFQPGQQSFDVIDMIEKHLPSMDKSQMFQLYQVVTDFLQTELFDKK
jgi:hypothetical protein